jgi:hypothetical protein
MDCEYHLMGSPSYFGKLACFESAVRKPGLAAFGLFNAADNLGFVATFPTGPTQYSQSTSAFSSTLVIDTSTADVITVVLTANVTSMTLNYGGGSLIPTGQRFWLRLVENSTGGWTVVLPSNLHYDQGFAIDTGANRVNILPIRWNGNNWEFFEQPFSLPL